MAGCAEGICDFTLSDIKTFKVISYSLPTGSSNKLSLSVSPGT